MLVKCPLLYSHVTIVGFYTYDTILVFINLNAVIIIRHGSLLLQIIREFHSKRVFWLHQIIMFTLVSDSKNTQFLSCPVSKYLAFKLTQFIASSTKLFSLIWLNNLAKLLKVRACSFFRQFRTVRCNTFYKNIYLNANKYTFNYYVTNCGVTSEFV